MSDVADPDSFERALGPLRTASLSSGSLRYRDHGSGVPVVFLAGLVLASGFWRRVVPALTQPVRAIVPDLPLGAHTISMRSDADLSPTGIADLIPELLDTLDLSEAVIVGNDTGGAIAKLLATRHPERVSALVLTPCECFENFLPPIYRYLQVLAHVPGALWPLVQSMRLTSIRRLPIAFGWLTKQPLDRHAYDSFLTPGLTNRGVRRDTAKVLRAPHPDRLGHRRPSLPLPPCRSTRRAPAQRQADPGHGLLHLYPRRPATGPGGAHRPVHRGDLAAVATLQERRRRIRRR
jgi:pimeloyl-ACP methyl ester carboxylesterase